MKAFFGYQQFRFGFMTALATSGVVWCAAAVAADPPAKNEAQQESVKIEPYKGDPIFLPEPEQVAVAPTVVSRETINDKLGDGKVERQVAHYSDNSFAADGAYREFYPSGKVFIQGQFRKGRQEGDWTYYFENGQVNRKSTYKDGKPNGNWEVHRADGTLSAKRGFKDGLRNGDWISYDESGKKPRTEEHYVDGNSDGVWKTWYPNGQLKAQVSFKKGKRDGLSAEFDEKGQKTVEAEWSDGKLNGNATRWFADGHKQVLKYENNRLISESK